MKKLLLVVAVACFSLAANAQEAGEFRFGPMVGLNISSATIDASHKARTGFNFGAKAEYNVTEAIFMTAGLQYSQRGVKDVPWDGIKLEWNPAYLEIPIHVGYRLSFSDKFKGFAEAGPYFAFNVGGKLKGKSDGVTAEVDLDSDEATRIFGGKYKKFEMGVGGAVGLEYSGFQLKVGYDYAITKLCDLSNSGNNTNFYVGIGYMF